MTPPSPDSPHALTEAQGATQAPDQDPNTHPWWEGSEEEWLAVEAVAFLRAGGVLTLRDWRNLTEAEQAAAVKAAVHLERARAEVLATAIAKAIREAR